MKKLLAMLLVLAMVLTLAACGGTNTPPASDPTTQPTTAPTTEPTTVPTEPAVTLPQNPAGDDATLVTTAVGQIRGNLNQGIYTYKGIPYAQATRRFVPAEDISWDGIFDATAYGPISLQQAGFGVSYSDGSGEATLDNNCQNLNIWTPGINDGEKRAVLVWLHGGAFTSGASSTDIAYDGTNLSTFGDVVVVSVNHRLNLVGYLDLSEYGEEYRYSGNVGQMDIVMALEWIQENIEAFGGDPDNVTIFGESGGGAKVLALMATPSAEGLFHRAIVESGTTDVVGPTVASKEAAQLATQLTLEELNITAENIEDLQTIDFDTLLNAGNAAMQQVTQQYSIEWGPVVDGDFMPTNPVTADGFAESGFAVPLLIGTNLSEWTGFGLMMGSGGAVDAMTEDEVLDELEDTYGDQAQAFLDEFREAYPNEYDGHALYVDTMIRQPSIKVMEHKVAQGGAPVYAYVFTWEATGQMLSNHMTEIPMVFHNVEHSTSATAGDAALAMEARMAQAWVNFAKTGDPSSDTLAWPAYDSENRATMIFDNESYVAYNHDKELLEMINPGYEYFENEAE